MRLALRGLVGYLNAYQGVYRQHASNMSIDYYRRIIRDFQQRKIVLDSLFNENAQQLEELRDVLWQGLAKAAMHTANISFKRGDLEQFDELRDFAASVYPDVRKLHHWRVQSLARMLGFRLGPNLQLVGSQLRRLRLRP